MTTQRRNQASNRRWIRKGLPCSVVVVVVGFLGANLYQALENARNAARSANTT
jgi:hypothetical protein